MKQQMNSSVSLKKETLQKQNMILQLAACFLLVTGFTGTLFLEWKLAEQGGSMILMTGISLCTAIALLLLYHYSGKYLPVLLSLIAALLLGAFLLKGVLSASLGSLMNCIRDWTFLHTGWSSPSYTGSGNLMPILLFMAVIIGIITELLMNYFRGRLVFLLVLGYLFLLAKGSCTFTVYGFLFLFGCILVLSAGIKSSRFTAFYLIATLLVCSGLILGIAALFHLKGPDGDTGHKLKSWLHSKKYEQTEKVLPEGDLKNLPSFKNVEKEVLNISCSDWDTLYLRGFQGGTYNGRSWEALSPEEIQEEKDLLAGLQYSGFYASSQTADGWKALGEAPEKNITITNTGACSAYRYLPYGADTSSDMDPYSICQEGTDPDNTKEAAYEYYSPEDSYLLVQQLSEAAGDDAVTDYMTKEYAYRDFVKKHYLSIPEKTEALLTTHKLKGREGISTAQACAEIKLLLKNTLRYSEGTRYLSNDMDFLEYMLNIEPSGYSVQYATLATMMLRSYGIPARYVEGYYIPASLTENLNSGDIFPVTQEQSSAWVEYYLDGAGWIPFDPVPNHTETIVYQLPVGEGDADQQYGNMGLSDENRKQNPPEQEEEEEDTTTNTSDRDRKGLKAAWILLSILIILLLAGILFLIIRCIILRRRMAEARSRFKASDPRVATAAILCVLRKLVTDSLKIPEETFFANPDHMVSDLLEVSEEELAWWKTTSDEIQFSRHEIPEETRRKAEDWLTRTEKSWNASVSLPRKILQKYILCKVY
ncbi:MAG: transglutaminase-like domain-containing protein [Lachnospiraceae bacterium]|nr:transglutaminase-like domain-containing protein [Lachnospiraceae bacterium]